LLEAARLATSAYNFQEWWFRNPETRKRLAIAANRQRFISYDVLNELVYWLEN